MTLAVWNGTAADESSGNLNVLVSPTVTVTDKATGAKPSLFSDRAGNTGIGNPFTAGADGSIEFYVAPGRYKIVADDGAGSTATWEDQLIGTLHGIDQPQESDLAYYDNANDRWTRLAVAASTIIGRLASGAVKALTTEETRQLLDDPEHATDSGTDTYVSATNTTPPADGVKITRDFQSANTTTTPTLDGKTMTTRDGSALWAGAVSGPHELQRDQTADTYLVLGPNKADNRDALAAPGTSSDPALAFDTWRTPNANRPTLVELYALAVTDGVGNGIVNTEIDESGGTTSDYLFRAAVADLDMGSAVTVHGYNSFIVPAGGSYRIVNNTDPNNANEIIDHREFTL